MYFILQNIEHAAEAQYGSVEVLTWTDPLRQGWPTFFISGPKYGPKKFSGQIFFAK